MSEFWGLRLGAVVLLFGALALTISDLPGLSANAEFLVYYLFWPILFFAAGFGERMPWAAIAATGALSAYWFVNGTSVTHWIAAVAAVMLAVLWALDRSLDGVLNQAADIGFFKTLAGKKGNAILTLPVGGVMYAYSTGLDGFASGQPALLACGIIYFLAAAIFRRRKGLSRGLGSRWRFKLGAVFVFSLLLAGAHHRLSIRPGALIADQGWRRALFCGSYAFLGWRWCYAMYGWAVGATGKELDQ